MNQSNLYATLNKAGCKVFSFEDYPSSQGSWRVSFFGEGSFCEVSCNRFDGYISLSSINANRGRRKSFLNIKNHKTDEAELSLLLDWLRTVPE